MHAIQKSCDCFWTPLRLNEPTMIDTRCGAAEKWKISIDLHGRHHACRMQIHRGMRYLTSKRSASTRDVSKQRATLLTVFDVGI